MFDYEFNYMTKEEISEMNVPRAKTINFEEIVKDDRYEAGLNIFTGVEEGTVGSKRIVMGRTHIPPKTANERHIHWGCEAAIYVAEGFCIAYTGVNAERQFCPAGTFIYVPEGEIHAVTNPDGEKDVVLIYTYGGVPTKKAAKTIYLKNEPGLYPPDDWDDISLIGK